MCSAFVCLHVKFSEFLLVDCCQQLCFLSHKAFFVGDSLGLELIGMVVLLDNSPEKKKKQTLRHWDTCIFLASVPG